MAHTKQYTKPSAGRYILQLYQSYYYNRRVPKAAQKQFGRLIRFKLGNDRKLASERAKDITRKLDTAWSQPLGNLVVDVDRFLTSSQRPDDLLSWSEEYLSVKDIDPAPTRLAIRTLVTVCGNKPVREIARRDAKDFVDYLRRSGNAPSTIRRRIVSVSAVISYAFSELEIERRNPFWRVVIPDQHIQPRHRVPFEIEELKHAYRTALRLQKDVRLLVPILGETGCRLGEIVGLRVEDVDLQEEKIDVVPHATRRLKTKGSERELPLVGAGLAAMKVLVGDRTEGHVFERYVKDGEVKATHASNALNKWLKAEFDGKTAHCLRHAFRDRLRAVECPLEMIDALGGWSSIGTVGVRYGRGYDIEHKRKWLNKIALKW